MTGTLVLSAFLLTQAAAQTPQEVIAAVRVQGNQVVPDNEVLAIAGITIGAPFTATTIAEVTKRLKDSGKFDSVEVLKRFASISDMSQITVVIIASEGSVRIDVPGMPGGPLDIKRRAVWRNLMFIPILDAEDGYGLTYGARVAIPKPIGQRSRLSFPLTWGGMKRAGIELDRTFASGPISRVEVGGAIQQRTNPAFEEDEDDTRRRVWARADRIVGPFRGGGVVGWQRVSFIDETDSFSSIGADATLDTRLDAVLPRNAVFATASVERLFFESGGELNRYRVDARGYVAVIGQQVIVVRALWEDASEPVPLYLRSLLGGWANLRGFEPGFKTGDTLVAGSIEYRFPISSPLSVGKLGLSVFGDWGTAYDKGQRFRDQTLHQGGGVSVWLAITAFRLSVAVAHGKGAGTRVSFGGGLTF